MIRVSDGDQSSTRGNEPMGVKRGSGWVGGSDDDEAVEVQGSQDGEEQATMVSRSRYKGNQDE